MIIELLTIFAGHAGKALATLVQKPEDFVASVIVDVSGHDYVGHESQLALCTFHCSLNNF